MKKPNQENHDINTIRLNPPLTLFIEYSGGYGILSCNTVNEAIQYCKVHGIHSSTIDITGEKKLVELFKTTINQIETDTNPKSKKPKNSLTTLEENDEF